MWKDCIDQKTRNSVDHQTSASSLSRDSFQHAALTIYSSPVIAILDSDFFAKSLIHTQSGDYHMISDRFKCLTTTGMTGVIV